MMLGLCLWKGCFEWCVVIIFRIAFRCQNWQLLPQTAGVQADRHDGNNNQHKILWWILYSTVSVFDYMQSHLAVADLLSAQTDMNRIQIQSLKMGKVSEWWAWMLLYSLLKWQRLFQYHLHTFIPRLFPVSTPVNIPETLTCPCSLGYLPEK